MPILGSKPVFLLRYKKQLYGNSGHQTTMVAFNEGFEEASFSHWLERETYPDTRFSQHDVIDGLYFIKPSQNLGILHAEFQGQYLRDTFSYC